MRDNSFVRSNRFKIMVIVGILILALGVAFAMGVFGSGSDFKLKTQLSQEEAGVPGTNIINDGWISETQDHIYYIRPSADPLSTGSPTNILIRRNLDWTEPTELTTHNVSRFVVVKDKIFYADATRGNVIYQMNLDGSGQQQLTEESVTALYVSEDIVYASTSDTLLWISKDGAELGRMDLQGTLASVIGDWVYYMPIEGSISRVKKDGTMDQQLCTDAVGYHLTEDSLYYFQTEPYPDNFGYILTLYQRNYSDTDAVEVLTVEKVITAQFDGGYLYYQQFKGTGQSVSGLFRVNPDGTETEQVNEVMIWSLDNVFGDWMYILEYSGERYRVKLDGSVGVLFE